MISAVSTTISCRFRASKASSVEAATMTFSFGPMAASTAPLLGEHMARSITRNRVARSLLTSQAGQLRILAEHISPSQTLSARETQATSSSGRMRLGTSADQTPAPSTVSRFPRSPTSKAARERTISPSCPAAAFPATSTAMEVATPSIIRNSASGHGQFAVRRGNSDRGNIRRNDQLHRRR